MFSSELTCSQASKVQMQRTPEDALCRRDTEAGMRIFAVAHQGQMVGPQPLSGFSRVGASLARLMVRCALANQTELSTQPTKVNTTGHTPQFKVHLAINPHSEF